METKKWTVKDDNRNSLQRMYNSEQTVEDVLWGKVSNGWIVGNGQQRTDSKGWTVILHLH